MYGTDLVSRQLSSDSPAVHSTPCSIVCAHIFMPSFAINVEQAAGEGGAEEEMDPAELAAKMDGVRAWLETTATPPKDQAESKGQSLLLLLYSLA